MKPDHELSALVAERVMGVETLRTWWNPIQDANHHAEAVAKLDPYEVMKLEASANYVIGQGAKRFKIHLTVEGRRAFWTAWAETLTDGKP